MRVVFGAAYLVNSCVISIAGQFASYLQLRRFVHKVYAYSDSYLTHVGMRV